MTNNNNIKKIIGVLFLILACLIPILGYILYCNLIKIYSCSENGLQASVFFTSTCFVILFAIIGSLLLTNDL